MRRLIVRTAAIIAALSAGLILSVVAFTGSASAHEVTGISATCDTVTVNFANFPSSGVTVHIAVKVGAHATITKDVFVTDTTTQAQVDISAETAMLFGATASVDVDVDWTFNGPQHVHASLDVTCGVATTTTTSTTTTSSTTTTPSSTSSTSTTSTTMPTSPTTTSSGKGSGGVTTTIGGRGGITGTPEFVPAQQSAAAKNSTGSTNGLPFTGSPSGELALVGLGLVTAGTTALGFARRRAVHR